MMNEEHVLSLVADYTLDLLTPAERLRVEEHTSACEACHSALQLESHFALMIGHTLHLAAQPAAGRLQTLMPSTPPRRASRSRRRSIPQLRVSSGSWTTRLAPVTLMLALLASSLWLYLAGPADSWRNQAPGYFVATEMAATATTAATATSPVTLSPSSPPSPTSSPSATLGEAAVEQTVAPGSLEKRQVQPAATPVAHVATGNDTN
jgi:hypothetical protein